MGTLVDADSNREFRSDCFEAIQNVNYARERIRAYTIITDDSHAYSVHHFASNKVHPLREHQVASGEHEGVLVVSQRVSPVSRCTATQFRYLIFIGAVALIEFV